MSIPRIYKPCKKASNDFYNHAGDTGRELIDMWKEEGYVNVIEYDGEHVWLGNIGETLLYDRPNYDWLDNRLSYRSALFGNPIPPSNIDDVSAWTFWGRRPKLLYEKNETSNKTFDERTIESIFIGKIENNVQKQYRDSSQWKDCIEFFDLIEAHPQYYKYTQEEYLEHMSNSKYGLSLRGFGPKCNREIEMLALGVVPMLHTDVDTTYYNQLREHEHYFRVRSPEDVRRIVNETSKDTWTKMSTNCKKWYTENASPKGSFDTTMKIVRDLNVKKTKPTSMCTFATNMCIHDMVLLLKSVSKYDPDISIYLLSDKHVEQVVKDQFPHLNIKQDTCLDEFSNKNRKQLENENKFTELMKVKSKCIDYALQTEKDTLYVDSDIVFLNELPLVDNNKDLGFCPHYIKKENVDAFGYFNAGMIYVNNNRFSSWWLKEIDTQNKSNDGTHDQKCLENAVQEFSHFEFDMTVDFGWWRLLECDDPQERMFKFAVDEKGHILYNNKRLNSLHTHFVNDTFHLTVKFNEFITTKIIYNSYSQHEYNFITEHIKVSTRNDIINILCQYYNDSNEDRQKEIDVCFLQNLNNPYVEKVVNFKEEHTIVPDEISYHEKYVQIEVVKGRLPFNVAFEYANDNLQNKLCCICNADIFLEFNSNWLEMNKIIQNNKQIIYALSRHEFDGHRIYKDPVLNRLGYANSQDAWFFTPTIKLTDVDFSVGTLGCDNAIAHRLKLNGYLPINSPNEYKIFHYDVCRKKNGANALEFSKKDESEKNVKNDHPELRGQYLCPDIDMISSIDEVATMLKLNKIQKYEIMCDMFSKYIKIKN